MNNMLINSIFSRVYISFKIVRHNFSNNKFVNKYSKKIVEKNIKLIC